MDCRTSTVLGLTLLLCLIDLAPLAGAAIATQDSGQTPAGEAGSEAEVVLPSLELLEFLGRWETDEGEWIAPEDLADENFVDLIEAAAQAELEANDVN